jgi:ESCRT-II complex subunit VPS36
MRKNNEVVISGAFEDLEALMSSAKEIIALAEQFAKQTDNQSGASSEESALLAQSASELGLITTKDMLGSGGNSQTLYLTELARNLAEFLMDDRTGVLKKAGGILTLVDLWAIFNRARNGIELVSPNDFEQATRLWESLRLPVRRRRFKSGILVVQGTERTEERTVKALLEWLSDLQEVPPEDEVSWDWMAWGVGVTAMDVASRFGWSVGVAGEELEMAEERGAVCREDSPGGVRYWRNWIVEVRDEEEDGMAWKPESEEQRVGERNVADEELSRDLERHFGI